MERPLPIRRDISGFGALTPTLPPATHTNSYALGGREFLLVEPATPYEDEQREWLAWARGQASQGRRAIALLITHHHPDHVGGLEVLAKELDLPVWGHRLTGERIGRSLDRELDEGDVIPLEGETPQRWVCLWTPGHAPGHLCFYEPDMKAVVVGDMVASVGTILIHPGDGDMARYLTELARLAKLDAEVALPAHGAPIENPSALFRGYITHRGMRERKILAALETLSEPSDIDALVAVAYDDTPKEIWSLAALSLRSHLTKLVAEGRVNEDERGFELASNPQPPVPSPAEGER